MSFQQAALRHVDLSYNLLTSLPDQLMCDALCAGAHWTYDIGLDSSEDMIDELRL